MIILQIVDIITTNIGIKYGCTEVNPIMKKIMKTGFPLWMIIFKIGIGIFITWTLSFGIIALAWIVFGLNIFMVVVVLSNLIGIYISKKRLINYANPFIRRCEP